IGTTRAEKHRLTVTLCTRTDRLPGNADRAAELAERARKAGARHDIAEAVVGIPVSEVGLLRGADRHDDVAFVVVDIINAQAPGWRRGRCARSAGGPGLRSV